MRFALQRRFPRGEAPSMSLVVPPGVRFHGARRDRRGLSSKVLEAYERCPVIDPFHCSTTSGSWLLSKIPQVPGSRFMSFLLLS